MKLDKQSEPSVFIAADMSEIIFYDKNNYLRQMLLSSGGHKEKLIQPSLSRREFDRTGNHNFAINILLFAEINALPILHKQARPDGSDWIGSTLIRNKAIYYVHCCSTKQSWRGLK